MRVFLCFIYAAKNDIMIDERLIGDGDLIVQRYDIQPVYFIGILGTRGLLKGHTGPEWEDVYFSEYTFREKRTHEVPD